MKKIKIVIDEDGTIKRDFIGFNGNDCFKEAKEMDNEMYSAGIKVKDWKIRKKKQSELEKEVLKV